MATYDDVLSRQYHSLKLYYGQYDTENVNYRIGDRTTLVSVETEKCYDTWKDFHLIPTERPIVTLPRPNTKLISIPGKKDPLNFSTFLTGHMTFGNRTGAWSFYTDNDFVAEKGGWVAFDKNLRNKIHGRIFKIVLQDDPGYFYAGQLSMGQWAPGNERSTVSISYNVYPYKKAVQCSLDQWKFDDFDFNDGFIQYLKDMVVDGNRTVTIHGSTERISPHIIANNTGISISKRVGNDWISYGTVPKVDLDSSESVIPRLVIDNGSNSLLFSGHGTVTIDYRRGLL